MADINNLELVDEVVDVDPNNLPQEIPQIKRELPQPDRYRFKLPDDLNGVWEIVQTADKGQRVRSVFGDGYELRIVHGPKAGDRLKWRVDNVESPRGKDRINASNMAFLLVKGLKHQGPLRTNTSYVEALKAHAGKEFSADLTWTATCSQTRDIFKDGAVVTGVKGCGQRYAIRGYKRRNGGEVLTIPRNSHGFMQRFDCSCGALLSAWPDLSNFSD